MCTPLVGRLTQLTRLPRRAVASVVFLFLLGVVAAGVIFAGPSLVAELRVSANSMDAILRGAAHAFIGNDSIAVFGHVVTTDQVARRIANGVQALVDQPSFFESAALGVVTGVVGMIMTSVLLLYILASGPTIAAGLFRLVPPKQRPLLHEVWRELDPVMIRYFLGVACVVTYATVAAYVGLGLVLHLPNALVLALVTGLCEIVPVVGPIASAILAGLAALGHSPSDARNVLLYVGYAAALRLSVDQVVSPLILGHAGRMHPVAIIFSFLAGGVLFGIVGIILAVPVAIAIRTMLAVLYEEAPQTDA